MALTDTEIDNIAGPADYFDRRVFARAIEAAVAAPLLASIAELTAQVEQAAQPVTHQFQARDGSWHGFIDERHMENTIKDGSWPIRALYTAPPKAVPLTEAQIDNGLFMLVPQGSRYWKTEAQAFREGVRFAEQTHNIGTPATVEKGKP